MSDFAVPDGFVEVDQETFITAPGDRFTGYFDDVARYFVLEGSARLLPVEHYTVILASFPKKTRKASRKFMLEDDGKWYAMGNAHGAQSTFPESKLQTSITSFEILSEPRAVTAKGVLDRVRDWFSPTPEKDAVRLDDIAREFGVTDETS